jgi:RimJ/RimL family protein N-acetyltransferase
VTQSSSDLAWPLHSARLTIRPARSEDLGIRRVVANSFADNTASWRLMERLGMRRELYTVAESLHRTKGWVDGVGYALLADEWRARNTAEGR